MHRWLNQGEAFRWYGRRATTEEDIRQKYLVAKPRKGTRCFIVQHAQEFIGFLQYYRIGDYPAYAALLGAEAHDFGMDLFIGRDDLLGRGLGTLIVKTAIRELIFAQADAERCLVGPSPDNQRAIRCYEKCGFRYVKTIVAPDGEHEYIMTLVRPAKPSPPAKPRA